MSQLEAITIPVTVAHARAPERCSVPFIDPPTARSTDRIEVGRQIGQRDGVRRSKSNASARPSASFND